MRHHKSKTVSSLLHRRGEMSTPALIFLILGIIFFVMVVIGAILAALLIPAVSQARTAARTTQAKNNMKQIGLAYHNYHDVYGMFPPTMLETTDGEPYHGWMTYMLPYMDQTPIYQQINFDEDWLSPTNQGAMQFEVQYYLHPVAIANDPMSSHVNGLGAAHFAVNSQASQPNDGLKIYHITDGTSNTLLVGEVAAGFKPWGDPENSRDPSLGLGVSATQFGPNNADRNTVMFLLADGSVREIAVSINQATLDKLADPRDGNAIGEF